MHLDDTINFEIYDYIIINGSSYKFKTVYNKELLFIIKYNSKVIGIYCPVEHHSFVSVVELFKKHLYPNAKIKHLHINK